MLVRKDPLLGALRIVVMTMLGFCCFAAALLVLATPFVAIFHADILAAFAAEGQDGLGWPFLTALILLMLGLAVLLGFLIYFFYLLMKITDTVRDGDPFVAENAVRLSRMGWTSIGGWLWSIVISVPGAWVASVIEGTGEQMQFQAEFGPSGPVMVLVLFVLARVFRHGAAMREDLEGTV